MSLTHCFHICFAPFCWVMNHSCFVGLVRYLLSNIHRMHGNTFNIFIISGSYLVPLILETAQVQIRALWSFVLKLFLIYKKKLFFAGETWKERRGGGSRARSSLRLWKRNLGKPETRTPVIYWEGYQVCQPELDAYIICGWRCVSTPWEKSAKFCFLLSLLVLYLLLLVAPALLFW